LIFAETFDMLVRNWKPAMKPKQSNTSNADQQLEFVLPDATLISTTPLPPLFTAPPEMKLPVDPSARGYHLFSSERQEAIRKLEHRFGLILNKPVRITLFDVPGEFCGKLMLAELLPSEESPAGLRLRLAGVEFNASEIESCVLLDTAP
jgi:hypothetical protein